MHREIVVQPLPGSEVVHVSMMFKQVVYLFPGSWIWIWKKEDDAPPSHTARKQVSIQRSYSSGFSGFVTPLALPCITRKSLEGLHKVDYNVEVKPTAELVGLSENADAEEVWFLRRPWNDLPSTSLPKC